MRILYLCHRFPYPPKRGGKIRPFNMIRHLARRHEVTVCSLARSEQEAEEAQGIGPHCARHFVHRVSAPLQVARMVARLPTPVPSSVGYFHSTAMARRVRALLATEAFDLIFVHCSSVAHYVSGVGGVPRILDFGDMDSCKWIEYARFKRFPLSLGYRLEGEKLRREEARLARAFDFCTATTRAEWQTLQTCAGDTPTDWFPNGVDAAYFAPDGEPYDVDTLSFVGRMDYYPNQECMIRFCAEVLPRLRARRPSIKLVIVGADPSRAIRRLGEHPGVTVTGSVPDVRPYVRRSALMIAPLNIARGTQNKILEAMAMGVPVVTSDIAAGGVDAVAGEHLLVAGEVAAYEAAVLRILEQPTERARLAAAGRARVQSHHDWDASMRRLDGIIERGLHEAEASRARRSTPEVPSSAGRSPGPRARSVPNAGSTPQ
jgi:sugar transferase (PEP-CTERM/EpsH1 system associated)